MHRTKRILLFVSVGALVLARVLVHGAALSPRTTIRPTVGSTGALSPVAPRADLGQLSGRIISFDANTGLLVVGLGQTRANVDVDPSTVFTVDGIQAAREQLQIGRHVVVTTREHAGVTTAVSVTIHLPKPAGNTG
jgi:hypothetical protein